MIRTQLSSMPEEVGLRRILKRRHVLMMSLGGTIGTGLFIGVAAPLSTVGPLGTVLAYLLAGVVMMLTILCLGELSCAFPHSGSFQHYALMFLPSPVWSYAIGWLYCFSWIFSIAADLTAAGLIAHQFFSQIPIYLYCLGLLVLLIAIHLYSVRIFGECEYWLAAIKVFAIIFFILLGLVVIYQWMTHTTWQPTLKSSQGWFPNGGWSIFITMTIVVYSFQGVELVGNAAGEVAAPQRVLPKVIRGIGIRIILFYILAITILALVYPYQQPWDGRSPFIWVFNALGLPNAGVMMQLVIFAAALSAGNTAIYASSRMLWSMGKDGLAPKFFCQLNKQGVPAKGVLFIAFIALVSLLSKYIAAERLYLYLIASTGQVGCLAWMVIAWCQYRFRRAVNQGKYSDSTLSFRSPWFPWVAWFSITVNGLMIVGAWFSREGGMLLLAESILLIFILLSYYWQDWERKHKHKPKSKHKSKHTSLV